MFNNNDDESGDYTSHTALTDASVCRTEIPLYQCAPGAELHPLRHRNEYSSYIRQVIRGRSDSH